MIAGIIQARMGSKRLPGKSILPLAGKPLLYRFIERVLKAKMIDKVILATTTKLEDDCLCDIAKELNIDCYRGLENDLIDRFYQCALKYDADDIVRFAADNPLAEAAEIDRLIEYYLTNHKPNCLFSNTHNIHDNGYPDGLGCEIYNISILKWLHENIQEPDYREHPHKWFFENNKIITIDCPDALKGFSNLKLDVNTKEEYEYVKSIYDKFGNNDFHFTDYARCL